MPTVFFTSDPHWGHAKAAQHRGFSTPEAHDLALIDAWNATVGPEDIVWILGDLAASGPTHALAVLATLPGTKHLISGNHDKTHPMHRDAHRHLRAYLEVFASVQSAARRKINGRDVLLSHFPYTRDRGEMRHAQWRLRDEGAWLLHGHTHGRERVTDFGTSEIHVGVDAWDLAPVSLETVADLIEKTETRRTAYEALRKASLAAWPTRSYLGGPGFSVSTAGVVMAASLGVTP